MTPLLEAQGLRKTFPSGDQSVIEVLHHVDLEVRRGEAVAVVGTSGAGKSTLLHLLGALDAPSSGEIRLEGRAYATLRDAERDVLRNRELGFVFQFHHLLREFSALENVMMPLRIAGASEAGARGPAEELLAAVGLAGRMTHRPAELSGGEQQRCAVARALVHGPKVVLADEPSGNLDQYHSEKLHELLFGLTRNLETALVVVTHNRRLAEQADRILVLRNGRLEVARSAEVLP